jgi:hypothetical protein
MMSLTDPAIRAPMIVIAVAFPLALCVVAGVMAIVRGLRDPTYSLAAFSLGRQKRPLLAAVIGSGLWMYGIGQWARIVGDTAPLVNTLAGMGGFAVVAAVIESRYPASLLSAVIGTPVGVGIGVLADAIHPLAAGGASNLWPLAILLWIALATPAALLGLAAGILGRLVSSKG